MEFWADPDHSVYRSWMTVEKLKGESGFIYQPYCLVIGFTEEENQVRVEAIRTDTNESEVFFCRKLILAAGVFGTARIILRSFNSPEKLPILTNAYAITPCLHLRRLGRPLDHRKTSLGQLELFYDRQGDFHDVSMVTFYTYRSHMLFKLVKESPLNMPASLALMRSLSSALVLGTINHPDRVSDSKYLHRVEDNTRATKDRLNIIYELSEEEARRNSFVEKRILRAFRSLGLIPLSKQNLKPGSVVHYAGTLPFDDGRFPYSLQSGGRLRDSQRVYVADGSGFKYLPANGLTFTLMANAHLVAKGIMNGNEKMTPARKTKTIAITGANSMIGESLVRYFAGKGWAVRCLQRRPKNAAGDGITYHRFSLPDTIDEADIAGADVLVHCAVQYYDLKNRNADVVNDEGTQKLLDLTRKHSTKFIFISTLSAHEEAESHYGMNKFALEKKFDPQRDVVLRLGLVMAEGGLFTSIADIVKKAKFIPLFDNGKQPIQTLHIDDLCKVFETVIEKDMAGVFNVAEPQAHTMKDLHEAISRKLQLNRFFIPLPLRILQMVVSTIEALKVPFPFTSENTLGLKCMRAFETQSDLDRLGVTLRSMDESIDSLLQKSG
jgi:nucleoside-diphosphate-sugar epimerase